MAWDMFGGTCISNGMILGTIASPKTSSPELVFRPAQRCRHEGLSGALTQARPARGGAAVCLSPTAGRALVRDQSSLMTRWWRFRPLFTWGLLHR
jgi:hypothetical protein